MYTNKISDAEWRPSWQTHEFCILLFQTAFIKKYWKTVVINKKINPPVKDRKKKASAEKIIPHFFSQKVISE